MNTRIPQTLVTIGAVILVIFLALLCLKTLKDIKLAGEPIENPRTITVYGESEVQAVPDTAEFSFNVIGVGNTSEEALSLASEKGNAILAYLEEQGIEDRDIRTTSLYTNPRYSYTEGRAPQIQGYESQQTVTVKVREQEQAGTIIAGVTERGADGVSGLTFTIDEDEEIQRQAREEAIEDAREEARMLAADLGVQLGEVVAYNESTPNQSIPYYREFAESDDSAMGGVVAPDLPTGENTYRSSVHVTFRIY